MDQKAKSKQTERNNKKANRFYQQKQKELMNLTSKLTSIINECNVNGNITVWECHLQLQSIINEIIEIESTLTKSKPNSRKLNLEKYVTWLRENKAEFEGIEVCEFEGYELGLKATKEFTEGSLMLTVPRKLMMSVSNAEQSELSQFLEIDPLKVMPNYILAFYLLLEKQNPDSFWKPYIDVLPEKYTTILYFTPEELAELRPSPVYVHSLKLYQSLVRWYAYFYKRINTMEHLPVMKKLKEVFTFENYRWAISSVMTRQNNIPAAQEGRDDTAFIPLWDMCNHEDGTITTDYNKDLDRSECYALREFRGNEQVFIFYGPRPNCDMFLHNGFVYPNNKHDSLSLALGISSKDPLRFERLGLLKKLGQVQDKDKDDKTDNQVLNYNLYRMPNPISAELLAFIRIFTMKEEELRKIQSNDGFVWELVSPDDGNTAVDAELDRRAYNYLLTRCALIRRSYKIEDSDELSEHRKNVKLLKQSEVQILDGAIDYLTQIIDKLPGK
ncbi:actin-histidine N-methyltransferase [Aricia agestis]|uniref:actin-histidine N-methyltransferase n=1 Tax=Aricia agestis TaxID=91739 RepID=UPI001C2064F7|nr:actin-histidine N-methyltransferase [Aricia agestis]